MMMMVVMFVMMIMMIVVIMNTMVMVVVMRMIVLRMDVDGAGMYAELDPSDPFTRLSFEVQMVVFEVDLS